jgi:hypothetical protein
MEKFKFNIKFIIIIIKFSLMFHKTFIKLYTGVKMMKKVKLSSPNFTFILGFKT